MEERQSESESELESECLQLSLGPQRSKPARMLNGEISRGVISALPESESEPKWLQLRLGAQRLKRPNGETSRDWISALPDSVLQRILSLLSAEDVIKTSVLSKRWRFVWANVPVLRFFHKSDKITHRFLLFVSKTLLNYAGKHLRTLCISFPYESSFSWALDAWHYFITFALKVEKLILWMGPNWMVPNWMGPKYMNPSEIYQLPQSIYSNSSLQVLMIGFCNVSPVIVFWTSLKTLSICYAKLTNEAVATILLGSPNLERLTLLCFDSIDKIIVTSWNIKLKWLVFESLEKSTSALEISAPHIHGLTLVGSTQRRMIKLINLSSLYKFDFSLEEVGNELMLRIFGELPPPLPNLSLSSRTLELLSTSQMLTFPLTSNTSSLVSLQVDSCVKEWDFRRIVTMLQASPNLEFLSIVMDKSSRHRFVDKTEYWESLKTDAKCHRLKQVAICGFEKSWCIGSRLKFCTSMVRFLLKTATVLEKIFICARSYRNKVEHKTYELADLSEVKQLISSYPRVCLVQTRTPIRRPIFGSSLH